MKKFFIKLNDRFFKELTEKGEKDNKKGCLIFNDGTSIFVDDIQDAKSWWHSSDLYRFDFPKKDYPFTEVEVLELDYKPSDEKINKVFSVVASGRNLGDETILYSKDGEFQFSYDDYMDVFTNFFEASSITDDDYVEGYFETYQRAIDFKGTKIILTLMFGQGSAELIHLPKDEHEKNLVPKFKID